MDAAGQARVNAVTKQIIGAAMRVRRELGLGFIEKVYENALAFELRDLGLHVQQQEPLEVFYRGQLVGRYTPDLIVERLVIVELKTAREMDPAHVAQCLNYLKATGLPIALLMNYGDRFEFKRLAGRSFAG